MIVGKSFLNGLSITSGIYVSYFKVLIKKSMKDKAFSVNKTCQESADVSGIKSCQSYGFLISLRCLKIKRLVR